MVRVSARGRKVAKNAPKFGLAKQNAKGTKDAAYAQYGQKWKEIHQAPGLINHKMVVGLVRRPFKQQTRVA